MILRAVRAGGVIAPEELSAGERGVALGLYDGAPAPEHLRTRVCAFWSPTHLSICFAGFYRELRTAPPRDGAAGKTPGLWELSDVYEAFIGPSARSDGKYREFQVAPDSQWIDIDIDAGGETRTADFDWRSGMVARSALDEGRRVWRAVMAIPLAAFSAVPRQGDTWDANFYRIAGPPDCASYLAWSPVGAIAFHQPRKFGTLLFV